MKKTLLLFLALCHLGFSSPLRDHKIDQLDLQSLLQALDMNGDIVKETQKHWIRSKNKERWEISELNSNQGSLVFDWAENHSLFEAWEPCATSYDVALILGATTPSMEHRLDYLKSLWAGGTRFEEVVWLTGERPLDQNVDQFTDICSTESEASKVIWEKADLPDEMRKLPVTFVSTQMKTNENKPSRPNTKDTLISWLETCHKPCKALFVSHQPFCGYQFAVINNTLPETFLFDVVGPACDKNKNKRLAAITLDSLARWIYEEKSDSPKVLLIK
jgi:hypothetical protein